MYGALVIALGSAALFAVGSAFQHRAAGDAPSSSKLRMAAALLRRPSWLLGALLCAAAFGLHATALHVGDLAIVQPVILSGIVFTVIVRSAVARQWPSRRDVGWSLVTWAGLSLAVIALHPRPARPPELRPILLICAAGVLAAAIAGLLGRALGGDRRRALLLGAAAGILYGLVAGLVKVTLSGHPSVSGVLGRWSLWALIGIGAWAVLLNQRAYQAARVTMTTPVLNLCQLTVGLGFGWVVFGERPAHSPLLVAAQLCGLIMIGLGVVQLARRPQPSSDPTTPTPPDRAAATG